MGACVSKFVCLPCWVSLDTPAWLEKEIQELDRRSVSSTLLIGRRSLTVDLWTLVGTPAKTTFRTCVLGSRCLFLDDFWGIILSFLDVKELSCRVVDKDRTRTTRVIQTEDSLAFLWEDVQYPHFFRKSLDNKFVVSAQ